MADLFEIDNVHSSSFEQLQDIMDMNSISINEDNKNVSITSDDVTTTVSDTFLKLFKCKHIIGIASRQKLVQIPLAAKDTPINQKRRRGRPKMATNSLLVD